VDQKTSCLTDLEVEGSDILQHFKGNIILQDFQILPGFCHATETCGKESKKGGRKNT
jgi:hypothetical protein